MASDRLSVRTCVALVLAALSAASAGGQGTRPAGAATDPPRLIRGAGEHRYRLTASGKNALGEPRLELRCEFVLRADRAGERIELQMIDTLQPPERDRTPLKVDLGCRRVAGGDEQALARFTLDARARHAPGDVLPPCAPRELYDTMNDVVLILSIQSTEFGVDRLRAVGDRQATPRFEVAWSHSPNSVHERRVYPGGEIVLEKLVPDRATLRWKPHPVESGVVRDSPMGFATLTAGTEQMEYTIEVDPRSGALLRAHCGRHAIDLQGWSPFNGATVPDRAEWPKTSGIPVRATRELTLERLSGE